MYLEEKQRLGLAKTLKNNDEIQTFVRQLLAIPFLPVSQINPSYSVLQIPIVSAAVKNYLEKLQSYYTNH